MALNPSIPLAALLVTGGFLAAGFAAQASALDERIEAFVVAEAPAQAEVAEATGHGSNGTIDVVYLVLQPSYSGAVVDLGELAIASPENESLAVTDVKPVRDDDGSLEDGILEGSDLVRLQLELASPMQGGEERTLVLHLADDEQRDELQLATPQALEDGYTRLDVEQR